MKSYYDYVTEHNTFDDQEAVRLKIVLRWNWRTIRVLIGLSILAPLAAIWFLPEHGNTHLPPDNFDNMLWLIASVLPILSTLSLMTSNATNYYLEIALENLIKAATQLITSRATWHEHRLNQAMRHELSKRTTDTQKSHGRKFGQTRTPRS